MTYINERDNKKLAKLVAKHSSETFGALSKVIDMDSLKCAWRDSSGSLGFAQLAIDSYRLGKRNAKQTQRNS